LSERLSAASLDRLPATVGRPGYDRAATRIGVVHFGPGGFHRAHQAWYFDEMLGRDPGLAISAVSLHSRGVRDALMPQDGLYTLVERAQTPRYRVIGAIREVLAAPEAPATVLARLAAPGLRAITSTVTEKGYCLTPAGDLDLAHPDIRHDLDGRTPASFPGWLVAGLRARRDAGVAPPVVISCDNLTDNGRRLGRAVVQLARALGEAALAGWIEAQVRFPNTMVDSITPATDDALRAEVEGVIGLADAWPVQREPFVQWVVEDVLGNLGQTFAAAGVTLARDVAAFERAKLRLLNGAHSTLAYTGLLLGHETVFEAMADRALAGAVERLMRQDVAASLGATPGLDLQAYIGTVLERFANPAIVHRLSQIAWDGSQKLPFRILQTAAETLAAGRPLGRLALAPAAWMAFVRRQARAAVEIIDPLGGRLAELGRATTGEAAHDVAAFLALEPVFPPALAADPRFRDAVTAVYADLLGPDPRRVLS
jgi:fructuronate reductase